jgi:hypothetical protein
MICSISFLHALDLDQLIHTSKPDISKMTEQLDNTTLKSPTPSAAPETVHAPSGSGCFESPGSSHQAGKDFNWDVDVQMFGSPRSMASPAQFPSPPGTSLDPHDHRTCDCHNNGSQVSKAPISIITAFKRGEPAEMCTHVSGHGGNGPLKRKGPSYPL